MNLTEQIEQIIKPYIVKIEYREYLCNAQVITDIEELFCSQKIPYQMNENHCDCGPGYDQSYYVFSWVEDGELYTYDILLEWF
jgi:hypothetical protein